MGGGTNITLYHNASDHSNHSANGTILGGHDDHGSDSHASSHALPPTAILFIFVCCALGAFVRTVFKKVPLPYTVVLLLFGSLFGILVAYVDELLPYLTIINMDPHTILHVFLPVLVFESAFAMDAHMFLKSIFQILVLAILGLMLASFLTALFSMNVFHYNWGWDIAMMFGCIVSATDPVAVVALLKDLGASKQLATLIEGESLLNDGAAIVAFNIFKILATPGMGMSPERMLLYFFQVAVGGPVFGFLMAKLTILWLVNIFNDAITEITITLASTYITFFVCEEFLKMSGVLAVVVLGVTLSAERACISPEVEAFLHRFWEMLAYIANTIIFVLVGVVITARAVSGGVDGKDWVLMIALYCAINVIRGIIIAMFMPVLSRIGYKLDWKSGTVMTWGGLRGAVGLALGLVVAGESALDPTGKTQNKILLHCSGIVLLTLLVNASTMGKLLKVLGMSDINTAKRMAMASATRTLQDVMETSLNLYKSDRFMADADWDVVRDHVNIEDPYQTLDEEADMANLIDLNDRFSKCPRCELDVLNEPTKREVAEMKEEARMRLLKAEKTSYWKQFEHGMLSREGVRRLVESVDSASDREDGFIDLDEIKRTWQIRGIYAFLKKKLEEWQFEKPDDKVTPPSNKFLKGVYLVVMHKAFEICINILIMLNVIQIVYELIAESTLTEEVFVTVYGRSFENVNYFFIVAYILEAVVKSLAYRKLYWLNRWNQFDISLIVLSIVDVILDITVFSQTNTSLGFNPNILKIAKVIRLLRLLRTLRFVKLLLPQMISWLNGRINKQLRFGYDIGKGFIMGEEEVHNLIEHMVDNKKIARELKQKVAHGRLGIIREMGTLQKSHPGIAVSVKTQQASRRILNVLREKILELRGEGVLDEGEAQKLEIMVETRMKKLFKMPAVINPPPPERIISYLQWVNNDERLIDFITKNSELRTMHEGEQLMAEGDPQGGIYIIVSGLVKVDTFVEDNSLYGNKRDSGAMVVKPSSHDDRICDYLSTGNIIGEVALLTKKPRRANIACDTSCQFYHISYECMEMALEMFIEEPSLEFRLWRVCATRLALGILRNKGDFRGWSTDQLKLYLDKSVLYFKNCNIDDPRPGVFDINSIRMADIVLIHGEVESEKTGKMYVGPCDVPSNAERLILLPYKTDKHVILIIPRQHFQKVAAPVQNKSSAMSVAEDVVRTNGGASFINCARGSSSNAALCLGHASEERNALRKRISEKILQIQNNSNLSLADLVMSRKGQSNTAVIESTSITYAPRAKEMAAEQRHASQADMDKKASRPGELPPIVVGRRGSLPPVESPNPDSHA